MKINVTHISQKMFLLLKTHAVVIETRYVSCYVQVNTFDNRLNLTKRAPFHG